MKHTLLATALAATAIVAAPIFSSQAQNAGAGPASPPAAAAPTGLTEPVAPSAGGQMAAEEEGENERGGAPMMEHHERHMHPMMRGMMGRMMMGEMGMRGDPQQRCIDRLAWRAARMAYVATKLDLTAAQRPLWDKIETAAENEQQKERQLCKDLGDENRSTVVERMNRWQQFLTAQLDGLRQAKPAVQALYQALTPEQRAIFNHPFGRS